MNFAQFIAPFPAVAGNLFRKREELVRQFGVQRIDDPNDP
jgi:hypothetical protein